MNEQILKNRIKKISDEKNIAAAECWVRLFLERFLVRLSRSKFSEKFIFKGGFLLSYLIDIGRETTDLDFLLEKMNAERSDILEAIQEIIDIPCSDGVLFSIYRLDLLDQPHMNYEGYRVNLSVSLGSIKSHVKIDIGVGDVVSPIEQNIELLNHQGSFIFEDEISLLVYPLEAIFAEKLETIFAKGRINSRMKDYHDILMIINQRDFDAGVLKDSLDKTFRKRETLLSLIEFDEQAVKNLQKYWTAHLESLDNPMADNLPKTLNEVIKIINVFLENQILEISNRR